MASPNRPQTGIFRTADLIFQFESNQSPSKPSSKPGKFPDVRKHQRTPKNFEEVYNDPRTRSRLLQTLCADPKAFYYHKQRCLLETRLGEIVNSTETARTRSVTPTFFKPRKVETAQSSPVRRPIRTASQGKHGSVRDELFLRVVSACQDMAPGKEVKTTLNREWAAESQSMKQWKQAQTRVRKMRAFDPDLLLPLYFLEKETGEYYDAEVLHTAQDRKANSSPVNRLLKTGRKANNMSPVYLQ